jgi:hypothetical protein
MWTPDGPKNIHGKSVTSRERGTPQHKKGDRVWVQPPNGPRVEPKLGTIEDGPKVSLRLTLSRRYDDGLSITDPPRPFVHSLSCRREGRPRGEVSRVYPCQYTKYFKTSNFAESNVDLM